MIAEKIRWKRGILDERQADLESAFQSCGVCLAYVFGSLARGREAEAKAISDLDIAVVFPDSLSKKQITESWYRLRAALEIVFGREDFDLVIANGAPAALRFRIIRSRDIIYCADEAVLICFEAQARREWQDMQYFRHIQRQSLERRYETSAP